MAVQLLLLSDSPPAIWRTQMPFVVHDQDFLIFRHLLTPDATIVDVGANAGQSIKSFKNILPRSRIISFEPNPEFQDILSSLHHVLPDVRVNFCGLSEAPGSAIFYLPVVEGVRYPEETSMSMAEFDKPWVRDRLQQRGRHLSFETFEAAVLTGDEFDLAPDLIKIDVEGAELAVISGFSRTIEKHQPYVFAENSDGARVTAHMAELGYLACMPDPSYTWLVRFGGPARANTIFVPPQVKV